MVWKQHFVHPSINVGQKTKKSNRNVHSDSDFSADSIPKFKRKTHLHILWQGSSLSMDLGFRGCQKEGTSFTGFEVRLHKEKVLKYGNIFVAKSVKLSKFFQFGCGIHLVQSLLYSKMLSVSIRLSTLPLWPDTSNHCYDMFICYVHFRPNSQIVSVMLWPWCNVLLPTAKLKAHFYKVNDNVCCVILRNGVSASTSEIRQMTSCFN